MAADRSVLFNLSATGIAEMLARLAQLVLFVLIARVLDPAGLGVVGAAWALFQLVLPLAQGAPETLGIRNLAADRDNAIGWIAAVNSTKMVVSLAGCAVLALYAAAFFGLGTDNARQTMTQGIVLIAVALSPAWAARAFQRTDLYAAPRTAQAVLFLLLVAAGLAVWRSPLVVPLADGLAWLLAAAIGFRFVRRVVPALSLAALAHTVGNGGRLRGALAGTFRDSTHIALAGVATAAIWWVPVLIAEARFGAEAGGYMAAAVRLALIPLAVLQLGLQVFLPVLSKYHATDRDRFREIVAALAFYSTAVHLAVALILGLLADPLVALFFGPGFAPAVPLIQVFAVVLVPLGAGSAYGYTVIAANQPRKFFLLTFWGAVAVLLAQVAGITITDSAMGIAWSIPCLIAQSAAFAGFAYTAGLVGARSFSLHRLAPASMSRFLMES